MSRFFTRFVHRPPCRGMVAPMFRQMIPHQSFSSPLGDLHLRRYQLNQIRNAKVNREIPPTPAAAGLKKQRQVRRQESLGELMKSWPELKEVLDPWKIFNESLPEIVDRELKRIYQVEFKNFQNAEAERIAALPWYKRIFEADPFNPVYRGFYFHKYMESRTR
ncbi:hypothetical protein FHETE_7676 [Fusarium heterosporum]|uniref:Uncharacterized protein n=1 Tax=Fusarium heterosporum TaxID=42747 RepID=A0A8H5WMC2_FUSHE|nr:hypothetical protein FHETE_7676 [Fusarium heterosporum]